MGNNQGLYKSGYCNLCGSKDNMKENYLVCDKCQKENNECLLCSEPVHERDCFFCKEHNKECDFWSDMKGYKHGQGPMIQYIRFKKEIEPIKSLLRQEKEEEDLSDNIPKVTKRSKHERDEYEPSPVVYSEMVFRSGIDPKVQIEWIRFLTYYFSTCEVDFSKTKN